MPTTAIAVLAHPDDAAFLCAGTLVRRKKEHGRTLHPAATGPGSQRREARPHGDRGPSRPILGATSPAPRP